MAPQILPPLRLIRKQATNPKHQEFKIVRPAITLQVLPPLRLKRKQTINPKYQEFKIVEPLIAPQVLPPLRLKRKRSRYQEFKICESGPAAKSSKCEETSDLSVYTESNEKKTVVNTDEKNNGKPEYGDPGQGEPGLREPKQGRPEQGQPGQGEPDQREPDCVFKTRHYDDEKHDGEPKQGEPEQWEPEQGVPEQGEPKQEEPNQREPDCVFKTRQYYDQGVLVTEWDFCPYSKIEEKIKNDLVSQGKECNSVNIMKYVEKTCNPIAYEELCKRRFGSTF